MLLNIINLPHDIRIGRIRSVISETCGIDNIILDNLKNHEDGKRITVGLIDEVQASLVMSKMNGYFLDGKKLKVEMVSKNESSSSWQHPKMPYYAPPTAAPMPYASTSNMFQPMMGQDLNISNNLPYYLTQTRTSDYGNPSAVPPVTYPASVQPIPPNWNQMAGFQNQPQPYAGQSYPNPPMFAPSSQEQSNHQKRDFGAYNSSGYDRASDSKRPRFADQKASNIVPGSNYGEETRNYDSNRSYNDRSSLRVDDRDRYDNRDQHFDREKRSDRDTYRDRSRFDNREHEYDNYDSRDRRDHESHSRGHYVNSERGHNGARNSGGYGSDRNDYSKRHDSGLGSEYTRKDNAPRFEPAHTYGNSPNNSTFTKPSQFGKKSGFAPNKSQSGWKNMPNNNKFGKGGSQKNDVGAKKFGQPPSGGQSEIDPDKILSNKARDQLIKTLLFPAVQKTIQIIINNCNNPTLNQDMHKKLRELVKTRIRDIIKKLTHGKNVTNANQLYNLYREQYPATEDSDFLATIRSKVLPPTNEAANAPLSDQQDAQESTNPLNVPLNLNPEPPSQRLPKHPNSDKRVYKEMKKQGKEMSKEDYVHPVDPQYVTAIDEEIEALRSVFIEACEPSPDEQTEKVRHEIVTVGVEKFLKFMKLHVSKRLSDDFNSCVRVHFFYKTPPRPELDIFLKQYDVISLKKSDKHKFFVATCNKADGYDRLLAMEKAEIGGETITFKPMHLLGAPSKTIEPKKKGNFKNIKEIVRNSQAKSLNKGQLVTDKKSQNAQNIDQESKSAQSVDEKPKNTQNIDIKSENTQSTKEESKDIGNTMKAETIDKTILSSLDADDLEDF